MLNTEFAPDIEIPNETMSDWLPEHKIKEGSTQYIALEKHKFIVKQNQKRIFEIVRNRLLGTPFTPEELTKFDSWLLKWSRR